MESGLGKRVTIIGGSIAGLFAGLSLLQRGWDVHIHESTHGELERRGAGVTTHQVLFDALAALSVASPEDVGIPIHTRKTFARDGSVVGILELPQIVTSWGRMYQLLRNKFPDERYHQYKTLQHVEQHSDSVTATFTDGSSEQSTLLVAADGIRSTVRQQLEPATKAEYAGYVAWRGLINEQDLDASERQELLPCFTFCLPDGEQVLAYPVAGEHHEVNEGQRRYNVVWYRPADTETALKDLLTDIDGNNNGESIAPDKVRPDIAEQMRKDSVRLLSPQHARLISKLENPFLQPIYDLTTKSMAHNRVAIIGDAAFTARPHLGMGISKAAEDAIALASVLDGTGDIHAALIEFDKQRRPANEYIVNRSRELGAYLQAQQLSEQERKFAELHRSVDAVMLETANMDSVNNHFPASGVTTATYLHDE